MENVEKKTYQEHEKFNDKFLQYVKNQKNNHK